MYTTIPSRSHLFFFLLLFCFLPVRSQDENPGQKCTSLHYERTEVRAIHSEIVNQDYELWISLPLSYNDQKNRSYPVIYLMDPYRGFSLAKGLTDLLSFPFPFIQEVVIVGVGYGGEGTEALQKWALGRTRDLTPVQNDQTEGFIRAQLEARGIPDAQVKTGGASLFLEFLARELVPVIETEYRIDGNDRMLSGFSFGGLFGLYALFHQPELFNKYFIGSPSIHYKDQITFSYESMYAEQHTDLNAEIFMSAGSLEEETSSDVRKMQTLLLSRNYESLRLKTVVFDKEGHASSAAAATNRALIELFGTE
jgi:predicted alpha/beta superfamily hydrolase